MERRKTITVNIDFTVANLRPLPSCCLHPYIGIAGKNIGIVGKGIVGKSNVNPMG
jgi:hypothetical protein